MSPGDIKMKMLDKDIDVRKVKKVKSFNLTILFTKIQVCTLLESKNTCKRCAHLSDRKNSPHF